MPIKFRCPSCQQFLGISRSKAGEISDCPMCGKTLRVPNLDGTVKPLPTPELNLDDSSLVDALGELAGIGTRAKADRPARAAAQDAPLVGRRSAPEPIALEPLVPAKPVAHAGKRATPPTPQSTLETTASVSGDDGTIDDPDAELRAIAKSHETAHRLAKRHGSRSRPAVSRSWIERAAIAGGFLVVGFGLALLLSPAHSPAPVADSAVADPAGPEAAAAERPPAAGAEAEFVPAVTGRITYVTESGDTRADDGAKIIALPEERTGTAKLDVAGFLVGASEADMAIAAASLRALGGDVRTADEQGEYALDLDHPGRYRLLVISRHQSRAWKTDVTDDVQKLLAQFFIRPSTLLGKLAYELQDFQYRGQGTSPRDFSFERD